MIYLRGSLRYVDLYGADLHGVELSDVNLYGADLRFAKNIPYIPMVCPEEGSFNGWKKVEGKIIKLEIPANAKRSSATTRKCRCEFAKVLAIYELDGKISEIKEITNDNYNRTTYKVGEIVYPDRFDDNRWAECTNGIHFYMNRQEAINH